LSGSSIGVVFDIPSNINLDSFKNAGNDFITDFTLGNTSINTNADTINLSDLLIGYTLTSNLSDFIHNGVLHLTYFGE
jgi:hypothetical protein